MWNNNSNNPKTCESHRFSFSVSVGLHQYVCLPVCSWIMGWRSSSQFKEATGERKKEKRKEKKKRIQNLAVVKPRHQLMVTVFKTRIPQHTDTLSRSQQSPPLSPVRANPYPFRWARISLLQHFVYCQRERERERTTKPISYSFTIRGPKTELITTLCPNTRQASNASGVEARVEQQGNLRQSMTTKDPVTCP